MQVGGCESSYLQSAFGALNHSPVVGLFCASARGVKGCEYARRSIIVKP